MDTEVSRGVGEKYVTAEPGEPAWPCLSCPLGAGPLTTPLTLDSTWDVVVKERLAIAERNCSVLMSPLWVGATCHLPVSCTGQIFALLFIFH